MSRTKTATRPVPQLPARRVSTPAGTTAGPSTRPTAVGDWSALLRTALRSLFSEAPTRLWAQIEEIVIRTAYERSNENQLRTARLLGLSRNVLRARLRRIGRFVSPAAKKDDPTQTQTF